MLLYCLALQGTHRLGLLTLTCFLFLPERKMPKTRKRSGFLSRTSRLSGTARAYKYWQTCGKNRLTDNEAIFCNNLEYYYDKKYWNMWLGMHDEIKYKSKYLPLPESEYVTMEF